MPQDINSFIASFRGGARPNRFKVIITWPTIAGTPNIQDEFVVTAAQLPASVISPVIVPYKGRQIPVPGDRIFEEWTATILNDVTFSHRNAFERWLNAINSHQGNISGSSNYKDMLGTIDVIQLDRDDATLKSVRIYNAFPTNLTPIDLGYDQNDIMEIYTVTFSMSHWESTTTT